MSRLAGVAAARTAAECGAWLAALLAASRGGAHWQEWREAVPGAHLGWCGWRAPTAAVADGVAVAVDGAIYNASELDGRAADDAHALAALYRRVGFEGAVRRANGDFAIALYDPSADTLWLARDRFGVKPLYYAVVPDGLAFASRPGALLGLPGVGWQVDPVYVGLFAGGHYRYFDNRPEGSPYARVAQLPAGHVLRYTGGTPRTSAYWVLEDRPDWDEPEPLIAERYRDLLLDAVALRLQRAERPAFTLSGGMDSSSVLSCAVRLLGSKQHAFSSTYADPTFDESREIQSMLDGAVDEWHPILVDEPDVFALVRTMVEAHEEPVATATWLSHHLVCQRVAGLGFGSLFGGLGGDELNAGEYEHFLYHFADLRVAGQEAELGREVEMWARFHDHPIYRKDASVMERGLATLVDLRDPGRCLPDRSRLTRYARLLEPSLFDLAAFEPAMEQPFRSYLKNRTYQDLTRETMPCCLRAEDRQTTAAGLDHFLPFLDHRLVELMFRVPGSLKFREGVAKHLLRQAMQGIVPEETRTRVKKTGWNAPAHLWWSGRGREQLLDLVASRAFRERGIYDVAAVRGLVDEHAAIVVGGLAAENHMMFLWQLVNLELWLEWLDASRARAATVEAGQAAAP